MICLFAAICRRPFSPSGIRWHNDRGLRRRRDLHRNGNKMHPQPLKLLVFVFFPFPAIVPFLTLIAAASSVFLVDAGKTRAEAAEELGISIRSVFRILRTRKDAENAPRPLRSLSPKASRQL
jgi:hypothetical protein